MLVTPLAAQSESDIVQSKKSSPDVAVTAQPADVAAPDKPLTLLYVRQPGRRADDAAIFGEGLADAVAAINQRDGGLNNVPLALTECDASSGENEKQLFDDDSCGGKAKEALLAIVWPREDVQRFALAGERDGLPLIAPASRDILADGGRLRWSFAPPASMADQAIALLQISGTPVAGSETAGRIGLFHTTDDWGVGMRDAMIGAADLNGTLLQTYSVRPGEAQDVVSTFRDFGGNPPDRLIVWGNDSLAETVLREAVKRNYPTDRILGGFADGAYAVVQALGTRASGLRVAALAAFGEPDKQSENSENSETIDDDAAPVSPVRMAGQLIGAFSIEALGAAQELGETRTPARTDVRNALERVRLSPQRMRSLDLAYPSAAFGLSCADHAGSLPIALLQWDGEKFVRRATPEAKAVPLAMVASRGDRVKAFAEQIGDNRTAAPPCPATDRSG
ncbi:ABC transporter substrate-binding protein [Notoacmeibacter sp. MSK16QG-6]|uniref:ABC transporter substrate-binding protein n=1 Tax=Notoacmeibacter sp. MSK16QG-6 TaxID=2957982 RepID=UPI0020A21972|nr:ABC transporter substrate-binding protein [Notoacmeibacter sp. MSK16QG-6]MCP1200331.1 ABC transporter substrate-binding protein [Notoacmeibacter sp. MSK16QG-6]